jgi:hypothetical protein
MPTLTAEATTTKQIVLKPALRRKLLIELRTFAELSSQLKALEHARETHKKNISALRDETGEQSLELEGYRMTLVAPIRKKFNSKKFVARGGDIELYNQSFDEVPGRPYERITCPGEKADEED